MTTEIVVGNIEENIFELRGQRVMLDSDLALLYGVETKNLNKAVKRNLLRFPEDFMFQLDEDELLVVQGDKAKGNYGGRRTLPYAFTENGIAMLSSVLRSDKAILVNISIMRIFTKLRSFLLFEQNLSNKVDKLEKDTAEVFRLVFERMDKIEALATPLSPKNRKKIGLKSNK